jgi:cell division protein FtsB
MARSAIERQLAIVGKAKSRATSRFLARKQAEYERLAAEFEQLEREVQTDDAQ